MTKANSNHEQFNGIIPALITPYGADGGISDSVTRQLVRHLISQGAAGFYLSGSTGEGFLQSTEERQQLLEIVLDEVKSEVPVIAHVGAMDTATAVQLTRHAHQAGAAAVSAVTPFYYKHGPEQVMRHYIDIVEAADIPLIAYHIPGLTGSNASVDFYKELSQVDGIIGLKFTSTNVYEMQQIMDSCGEDFLVFNGPDEICLAGLTMGACGAIGSTYNIMMAPFAELYRLFHEGKLAEARTLQYEVNRVIRELLRYDFIAFEREILRLQGFEVGSPRKPIQQLIDAQRADIYEVAKRFSFLNVK
ncbi:N-acetylneuraminate lyase [Paenibacillus oenotherae]|uniref:N-acetylneuraminate lyase n=1 Tax=Paenibacillus oenotherae TaxID=1435645 RepID=A0ABS7D6G6_9BACL|nr:N-acetylneuraminate lyase [Paenibacillus oenotherae]